METTNIVATITQTINALFNSIFQSIDTNVYEILDDIVFVDKDILKDNLIETTIGTNGKFSIILIANALIIGFAIFYATRYLFSSYTGANVEKPYQFIFKLIMVMICINFSYFICEQIININSLISSAIREIGENIFDENINFQNLILKNNLAITEGKKINVFSFDGIISSFTSFGLLNLVFSYALRYIMIKVFVLMSPLVCVTLLNTNTSWIFKSWIKSVLTLLLVQVLLSIILLIIFSMDFSVKNTLSKILYIGSIYALIKANRYTRQIFGGISTEVSGNIATLKQIIK